MWATLKQATSKILSYWRNSLVDGCRLQGLEYAVEISGESLKAGKISSEKVSEVKARFKEASRAVQEKGREAAVSRDVVPVLVCPFKLVRKYSHYQESAAAGDRELVPLWIPAFLNEKGELQPREDCLPWIARDMLEPTTKRGVTIGDIEDVERFLSESDHEKKIWDSWSTYWDYAHGMLKAMPDGKLDIPGYVISRHSYVMPDVEVRGAAMNAIKTLDYIIETGNVPPLLEKYATLDDSPEEPLLGEKERFAAEMKHVGQMNGEFPLSPSQREALHHILMMENGDIMAVNGPPGTGKTVLMHSVAASAWVEAAVKQADPPITVVVSSNNQAVTNMIDSFGRVAGKNGDILSKRWLPEVDSYGLYCPSGAASQREESDRYQKAAPGDNNFPARSGFPGKVEDPSYIESAARYYLERFNEYTGKPAVSVREAVALLHQELVENVESARAEANKSRKYGGALAAKESVLVEIREKYGIKDGEDLLEALKAARALCEKEAVRLREEQLAVQREIDAVVKYLNEINEMAEEMRPKKTGALRKIISFISRRKEPVVPEPIQKALDRHETALLEAKARQEQIAGRLAEINACIEKLDRDIEMAEQICAVAQENGVETYQSVQEKLDTSRRYRSFLLAARYWEGRWLLEVRRMQELANRKVYFTPEEKVMMKWRRYAMLTPVIVSTLYVAPRLFTVWQREGESLYSEPILESIDILIVDEAGQVPPELAAAAFALARKAVVVGDVLQIEPVYNITRYVDQGNLIRHGLIQDRKEYPMIQSKGIAASSGSAMLIAQRACPYWPQDERGEKYPDRGMFLSEHRRCLDDIISFCNRLAYGGRLVPMRGSDIKPGALPPLSCMHVEGKSVRVGSSRKNEKEALAVLEWLLLNSEFIKQKYGDGGKPLKDLVAVLTPFTAQKKFYARTVHSSEKYEPLRGLTFGTIHALQGAEREVVVFSPVYTRDDGDPGEFFFNTDIRMLNVAVSRAREAFVVIGDMEVFKKSGGPAGLLAEYIFASDSNLASV
ncbi:MAG: AAA domain-containing protein [Peptococcaceae bacterium MAG4]|nr:AAA domain-containing protein [Peptococcaceae bacterium MAG4]